MGAAQEGCVMGPSKSSSRKEWLAAIVVSMSLHALIGLAWLGGRHASGPAGTDVGVLVDGPDDHETVFVLRDSPPLRAASSDPKLSDMASPPRPLPPSVISTAPGPDSISAAEYSPTEASSSPTTSRANPLHRALKPGKSIVYVIDRSSSMGVDGFLQQAIAAVQASLAQPGLDVRFQIVAYNGGTSELGPELWSANLENESKAARWLGGLTAEGRSNHRAGMLEALRMHPDAVFLLTDADDLEEKEVRAIRALIREPVSLNVAVFGSRRPVGETPLEQLTRDFGGSVRYVGR
jgi:hypothetical protein